MMVERTKEAMLAAMVEMNKENKLNIDKKKLAVMNFKNANKVGNKIFLDIPVESMQIDREMYQRPLQSHVRKLAKEWNDDKCDPLMVNYRNDGYFYVIDGQHRLEAALMRGIESLVCVVFVGLSLKEEADIFTEQNEGTKKLSPYDTYKANICRGEFVDTQIKNACDRFGIRVVKENTVKTLKSVTAARNIVRTHGKESLEWIFTVIDNSGWNNFKDAYTADVLASLNNVRVTYSDNLTYAQNKLQEFFTTSCPREIIAFANAEYPHYQRQTRLHMILDQIIKEGSDENSAIKDKIRKIA